ncbi:MAG: NAD(P)/FAD-dependent oxidoreductase [Pseudomonadota bacterium]
MTWSLSARDRRGLAASVYAASEGLDTLVIEPEAPGGQAGTSSKIENYLGFPTGISGQALAARAMNQAQKFGAVIAVSRSVTKIDCENRPYKLHLSDGEMVPARAVVLACGARYRQLALDGVERYEGKGVHFAATAMEGGLCAGHEVVVIGGGNSAGQAAVFLSQRASHVHMLVRSKGLAESMSRYLSARIDASPDITLYTETELTDIVGEDWVEEAAWRDRVSDGETRRPVRHIFVMIGAVPNTGWLDGCVALDEAGFVRTGPVGDEEWPLKRPPFSLETSRPGIFAVGDVRTGSVKRVASAVGEGSMSIQFVHQILND